MAPTHQGTKPEHMLPIMIVLGIMFVGICIAMNLFSRARFKKRSNVFAVAGSTRTTVQRRTHRSATPGGGQRLGSNCPSPMPPKVSHDFAANMAHHSQPPTQQSVMGNYTQSIVDESGRTSVVRS